MKRRIFIETLGAGTLTAFPPARPARLPAGPQTEKPAGGRMDPWIEIDLDAIAWNFAQVKRLAKVPIMAVVKANAYGHGLVEVSKALEKAGADWLMTGKLAEAAALRDAGVRRPILNFGPFSGADIAEIVGRGISQSVYTEDAALLHEAAVKLGKRASVHIDIDTGMRRTGVPHDKALPLIYRLASLSGLKIDGVCTTLTEDADFDKVQIARFNEACSAAEKVGVALGLKHAASSAGIMDSPAYALDMIRPGIALYGYYPNARTRKEDALKLRPALKFKARVIFTADLEPGDSLSYLRAFKAPARMRAATLGLGYSDGFPQELGGKGFARIRGKTFPLLKAVTANHMMVDLGDNREVQVGDEAVLIDNARGSGMTADVLSGQCGLSDYRILIGLSPLLPRIAV